MIYYYYWFIDFLKLYPFAFCLGDLFQRTLTSVTCCGRTLTIRPQNWKGWQLNISFGYVIGRSSGSVLVLRESMTKRQGDRPQPSHL